ncbi:hypothetical protein E05_44590 [Plautia stali symbiont]|nr:hypothetical protein E05_44590 [Plautia stali symbiont]
MSQVDPHLSHVSRLNISRPITTLSELAELLHCSRRHMRNLLNAMQAAGWLIWQAEAGRGKRSLLSFCYTGLALQQQRAEDLLEQDRIDQLVQLVGDKN